ncbi:protein aurora borealis [Rhinophrynus dorsalis]
MGDVRTRISPETPGRAAIFNPFESPSDYSSLHEPFVSSPTVFKPSVSSATPQQFRWSIDQLAAINPVEIDSEDIHRQALYLSHAKLDKEIEERRQKAIEEFFTKRTIVPSPWTQHEVKQTAPFHSTKCADLTEESPIGRAQAIQCGKSTVGCQTQLSLPVDFNLEKVLGEYFRAEENAHDQSQDNLSSSSLRRKLFLDGQGSSSECSSPPPLPKEVTHDSPPAPLGVLCSIDLSPVRCRSPMQTPSSGQFSSSPIQGGRRAYSLGSIASPTFLGNSPLQVTSPSFSPISVQLGKTPLPEQKRLTFPSPDNLPASRSMANSCVRSPYIEGCSPIKTIFQIKQRSCRGNAQYRTSLFQIPFGIEHEEDKENSPPSSLVSPEGDFAVEFLNLDSFSPAAHLVMEAVPTTPLNVSTLHGSLHAAEELRDNDTVEMVDPVETEDDPTWAKDDVVTDNTPMTSFMTSHTFSVENSHMCMSPLAESSVIPCENSSIQVDSGYTTQTCGSSIMDGIVAESTYKENDIHVSETQNRSQHAKI